MVHRIKIFILFCILFVMLIFAVKLNGKVEAGLLQTFLPKNLPNYSTIITLANKSASDIKVVFEADSEKDLYELKDNFLKDINEGKGTNKDFFEVKQFDFSYFIKKYSENPQNFLSSKTRKLLINKDYEKVYENALEYLYNPTGMQISEIDKNPFFLTEDFVLSITEDVPDEISYINGKYYSSILLNLRNNIGLVPDVSSREIVKLIKIQQKITNNSQKIYFAGTPIHSYYTSIKAKFFINLVGLVSILLIFGLTYFYFRNLRTLIPMFLSVTCGLLAGYIVTRLWFESFLVITMVFSATLIGIGIDYSYHYLFHKESQDFNKNITLSLFSTLIPFLFLYFTKIELLQQIAIFVVFGLLTIYLIVVIFFSSFPKYEPVKSFKPYDLKYYKILLFVLLIVSLAGFIRLKFNDTLSAFYLPSKKLQIAESLYNKINNSEKQLQFIVVQGKDNEEILEKEEIVADYLDANSIKYFSISKFIPSIKRQQDNFKLVKGLYSAELGKYSDILTREQITRLRNIEFLPSTIDIEESGMAKDFMIASDKSIIIVNNDTKISPPHGEIINVNSDVSNYINRLRNILVKLLPVVFVLVFVCLSSNMGIKNAFKILISPVVGIICSVGITLLLYSELNIFSILALFMILGFTIDYAIFRNSGNPKAESSILIAFLTTSIPFLLLTLSGFKLLNSISSILFVGLLASYITGLIIFKRSD